MSGNLSPEMYIFPDEQRAAVYRVIEERRDVRRDFLPDPIPPDVLERVLAAAHRAPSVGFSQPWDFIVIADPDRRARIKALAERAREGLCGCMCVVRVITARFAGQKNVQRVVQIVVPLRVETAAEQRCIVVVILDNEMNLSSLPDGLAHLRREQGQEFIVPDGMDRVEP